MKTLLLFLMYLASPGASVRLVLDCDHKPTEVDPRCCPSDGVWSEWISSVQGCSVPCGSCSKSTEIRTCLSDNINCPCRGETTQQVYCAENVCFFPYLSCCKPFRATVRGPHHVCNSSLPPEPVRSKASCGLGCCPPNGIWGEWEECPATSRLSCGSCQTAVVRRRCDSEIYGCPCKGPPTYTKLCKSEACDCSKPPTLTYESCAKYNSPCCPPFTLNPDGKTCGPPTEPLEEIIKTPECCPLEYPWSAWTEWTGCTKSCGFCGSMTRRRTCPARKFGCSCGTGYEKETKSCGSNLCDGISNPVCCKGTETFFKQPDMDDVGKWCAGGETWTFTIIMKPIFLFLIYLFSPAASMELILDCDEKRPEIDPRCCPRDGIWSEWITTTEKCPALCGSCATVTEIRNCLSDKINCPCRGETTQKVYCGTNVCFFPLNSCCYPYTATVINHDHVCSSPFPPEPVRAKASCSLGCCPPNGIWSEWEECSTIKTMICGACQTAVVRRRCDSEIYGCPCKGPPTYTKVCKNEACDCSQGPKWYAESCTKYNTSCCPPYTLNPDGKTCGPETEPPEEIIKSPECCPLEYPWGVWSRWSICTAKCGFCGTKTRTRTCPAKKFGCSCGNGLEKETKSCGYGACDGASNQCCKGTLKDFAQPRVVNTIQWCSGGETWSFD
ncbi:unnamed protein product [Caenorhabditis auriculariae]|uniref:Uncharacterized protein n=1 Tax=Caenorhabditis auriculariae TaxID=2777116 RepID=A0A8S1HD85_9PELO|nr:unnamed protein product [Caenorhabditis auriculariae]